MAGVPARHHPPAARCRGGDLPVHIAGWLVSLVAALASAPGLTVADTKHDLVANPAHFLAGATTAYTDVFTLGQLQNQAYGYLFPQGLLFLLADPLPDWIAQRLWWTIILGLGFSGMLRLLRRATTAGLFWCVAGAVFFTASPRITATVGAISSEAWPVVLAPWIVTPLLETVSRPAARRWWPPAPVACSVVAAGCLGAVNATANLFAVLPALVVLAAAVAGRRPGAVKTLLWWCAGVVMVSLWWIIPLLVMGRWAVPFTDFIESARVTTRWLNPVEVLRGTTHWVPFADGHRPAATAQATSPTHVLATGLAAACGLAGLAGTTRHGWWAAPGRARRAPVVVHRGIWVWMFGLGVVVLCAAHGPLGGQVTGFLDGAGVALRNLHKADVLVRLPLAVGITGLAAYFPVPVTRAEWLSPSPAQVTAGLVALAVAAGAAPVVTGQLAPAGAVRKVPDYIGRTADWINAHGATTRTLIYPPSGFGRFTWGNTNDEPLQPLLDVPWAVRDAIPLTEPGAIRLLDGMTHLLEAPGLDGRAMGDALATFGIGLVAVRRDLSDPADRRRADRLLAVWSAAGYPVTDLDGMAVVTIDESAGMATAAAGDVTAVQGAPEIMPLVAALAGPGLYTDTTAAPAARPRIVTDTPQLVDRNYGRLRHATSAVLAEGETGLSGVTNPVTDYPTRLPPVTVHTTGGTVTASSQASSPISFGGSRQHESVTALTDGDVLSAWYPQPGDDNPWVALTPDRPLDHPELVLTAATGAVTATVTATGGRPFATTVELAAFGTAALPIPADGVEEITVRVAPRGGRAGLAELSVAGHPVGRTITVDATGGQVSHILLQTLTSGEKTLNRAVVLSTALTVTLDAAVCRDHQSPALAAQAVAAAEKPVLFDIDGTGHGCGHSIDLAPGRHTITGPPGWLLLSTGRPAPPAAALSADGSVAAAAHPQVVSTGRAARPGLSVGLSTGSGNQPLAPTMIAGALAGAVIPPHTTGRVTVTFRGDRLYRGGLAAGGLVWLVTMAAAGTLATRYRRAGTPPAGWPPSPGRRPRVADDVVAGALSATALWLIGGLAGVVAGIAVAAVSLTRLLPQPVLAGISFALAALWLAHAPWPAAGYAGDRPFVVAAALVAIACVLDPTSRTDSTRAGCSTST
nr:alpha-(1->3)-arabinofuranosyltransferase family protein [Corynebacterium mendelii]